MSLEAAIDDGWARVRGRTRFLPLLNAWQDETHGSSFHAHTGDADLLTLVLLSASQGGSLTVALPPGETALPLLAAVLLAVDPMVARTSRLTHGPVGFVTPRAVRTEELRAMHMGGLGFESVGLRRLRGDGYVAGLSGTNPREATPLDRLIVVSPRAGFASPHGIDRFSCVVVDASNERTDTLAERASMWAQKMGAATVLFTRLDAQPAPDWTVDWPYIVQLGPERPSELPFPAGCEAAVVVNRVDDPRIAGITEARAALGRLAQRHAGEWPPILRTASRLARQLLTLCVPPEVYDAHTVATWATPIHQRVAELREATARRDLPSEFAAFAETDWSGVKWALESATQALEARNMKAQALGSRLEAAVRTGERLTVVCETAVEARALETYLLRAGWGVPGEVLEEQIRITSFSMQRSWTDAGRLLLTGVPPHRHRHRVIAGDVESLEFLCYASEEIALATMLHREFNAVAAQAAKGRAATLRRLTGAAPHDLDPPPEVMIRTASVEATPMRDTELGSGVKLSSAAEDAALADLAVFDWLPGEDEEDHAPDPSTDADNPSRALAVLAEPGPVILLLALDGTVERIIEDRVVSVPVVELAAGMEIVLFGAGDRRSLFRRIAPHLDQLRGPGTRLWLRVWRDALAAADKACGSRPSQLAAEIRRRGGDVKTQAVAEWASPYRIGPAKDLHVHLVAAIAADPVAEAHSARIGRVMRGVRQLHRDVGRAVASAARRHLAGRPDALDTLERILGAGAAETVAVEFEELSAWKLTQVIGIGTTRTGSLGRPFPPRLATSEFVRENEHR